jgi:putative acetyltransferase
VDPNAPPPFSVVDIDVRDPLAVATMRELFLEYAAAIGVDLCFQGFDDEVATLPGRYGAPGGALVLAADAQGAVGCVALREQSPRIGEMKRLFVRPRSRGTGLGRALALAIIDRARRHGYDRLRLDTLPIMGRAIHLYEALGFRDIAPYTFNPVPGARYMELPL